MARREGLVLAVAATWLCLSANPLAARQGTPKASASPAPTPKKDEGDKAVLLPDEGTEIEWNRKAMQAGRLKVKRVSEKAAALGWKKGDEIEGTGPEWRASIHDLLDGLKADAPLSVKRGSGTIDLPLFFRPADPIESDEHGLRPLMKAQPILVRGPKGNVDVIQEAAGHVLVLNFWATWCGPCRSEMPAIEKVSVAFAPRGVRFVGLNMDAERGEVESFLKAHQVSYLNVRVGTMNGTTGTAWSVDAIPLTVVVRPDSKIAMVQTGFRGERHGSWLSGVLEQLLQPDARPLYLVH